MRGELKRLCYSPSKFKELEKNASSSKIGGIKKPENQKEDVPYERDMINVN